MVSVYALKPRFQRLLRPLLQGLAAAGVTPNQITVTALDGMMARELDMQSHAGAFLAPLVVVTVLLSVLSEMAGGVAAQVGAMLTTGRRVALSRTQRPRDARIRLFRSSPLPCPTAHSLRRIIPEPLFSLCSPKATMRERLQ